MLDDRTIARLIRGSNRLEHRGRAARLKFLLSIPSLTEFPVPALAWQYYQEARVCWYMGSTVSTILMTQLAFEELLRSTFRVAYGVGGKFESVGKLKKFDDAGFSDLIKQGKRDEIISEYEAKKLHKLRGLRNPYVHVKDIRSTSEGRQKMNGKDFLSLEMKIRGISLLGKTTDSEAGFAISLLCRKFPEISYRLGGL